MRKALLFLTLFVLTLFVNAQDKMGFGNDAEGADSAGFGTVTTWVKPAGEIITYSGILTVGEYHDRNTNYGYYQEGYYDTLITEGSINPIDNNLLIIAYTASESPFLQVYDTSLPANTDSISINVNASTYWAYWCGADYNYCTNEISNPFPAVGQTCSIEIKYTLP